MSCLLRCGKKKPKYPHDQPAVGKGSNPIHGEEETSNGNNVKQVMAQGMQAMEAVKAKHAAGMSRAEQTHKEELEKLRKKNQVSMETLKTEVRAMVKRLATELEETQKQRQAESEQVAGLKTQLAEARANESEQVAELKKQLAEAQESETQQQRQSGSEQVAGLRKQLVEARENGLVQVAGLKKQLAEARESEAVWKAKAERAQGALAAATKDKPFDPFATSGPALAYGAAPSANPFDAATDPRLSAVSRLSADRLSTVSRLSADRTSTSSATSVQDLAASFSARSPLATGSASKFVAPSSSSPPAPSTAAAPSPSVEDRSAAFKKGGSVPSPSSPKLSPSSPPVAAPAPAGGGGAAAGAAQLADERVGQRDSASFENLETMQSRTAAFSAAGSGYAENHESARNSLTLQDVQGTLQDRSAAFTTGGFVPSVSSWGPQTVSAEKKGAAPKPSTEVPPKTVAAAPAAAYAAAVAGAAQVTDARPSRDSVSFENLETVQSRSAALSAAGSGSAKDSARNSLTLQDVQGTLQDRSAEFQKGKSGEFVPSGSSFKGDSVSSLGQQAVPAAENDEGGGNRVGARGSITLQNLGGTIQSRSAAYQQQGAVPSAEAPAAAQADARAESGGGGRDSLTLQNLGGTLQSRSAAYQQQASGDETEKTEEKRNSIAIPNGPTGSRSDAMKKKEEEFQNRLQQQQQQGESGGGAASAVVGGGGAGDATKQRPEQLATVFIISDDSRLTRFGPQIEYNGHDAFELNAVGAVTAKLDARNPASAASSPDVRFVFKHLSSYPPGQQRAVAEAHTASLVRRLETDVNSAATQLGNSGSGGGGGASSPVPPLTTTTSAGSKSKSKKKKDKKAKASAAAAAASASSALSPSSQGLDEKPSSTRDSLVAIQEAGGLRSKAAAFQGGGGVFEGGGGLEATPGERKGRESVTALQDSGAVKSASDSLLNQGFKPTAPVEAAASSVFLQDEDRSSIQNVPSAFDGIFN